MHCGLKALEDVRDLDALHILLYTREKSLPSKGYSTDYVVKFNISL
jgi:hypothetical protein